MARTKWTRGKGATLAQVRPIGRGKRANKCPECGANPNTSCVRWKEADGVRFVASTMKTFHAAR